MDVDSTDVQGNTLNCALLMDVPFLEQVPSADLMSMKNNDGEARHETDLSRVRAIIEDTQHEPT